MATLRRADECVSDLVFDQWLGASIDAEQCVALDAHVQACVRCSLRGETLAAQRAAFLTRVPTWDALGAAMARRGRRSEPDRPQPQRWLWSGGAALAACVALAFGVAVTRTPEADRARAPSASVTAVPNAAAAYIATVRSKGAPHIGAYVKRGANIARAQSGDIVRAGDYLRFTYTSEVPVYFALLNRDANRAATYYPLSAQMVRVDAGTDVALDFSIQLDAQPGAERVHGVFCDEPRALEPLRAELEKNGALPLLPHCHVDVLALTKQRSLR